MKGAQVDAFRHFVQVGLFFKMGFDILNGFSNSMIVELLLTGHGLQIYTANLE